MIARHEALWRSATLVVLAALVTLSAPRDSVAQTILNVERLQPGDVSGWHWGVEGELTAARGNDRYVDLLAGVVTGVRGGDDWIRVFLGVEYNDEDPESTESERYVHVRYNRWWAERTQTFHFFQHQGSRAGRLQRRTLLGTGIRHRFVDGPITLDVGTGAMREWERLDPAQVVGDHPVESAVWRMANLVVATRSLTQSVRLVGVAYIQPDLAAWGDLRTLTDLSLQIALTENVDLTVRGEWRHDSRPPQAVRNDDLVLSTGFTVSFR